MSLSDFPSADSMVNDMLASCEDPRSIARVRINGYPWRSMPGPELLKLMESELPTTLTLDSVTIPA